MATVTFFGHRDTPKETEPALRLTLIDLIENKNATVFYVGNHGNFDAMVRRQLEDLSKTYPIKYYVVLAYMPVKLILKDFVCFFDVFESEAVGDQRSCVNFALFDKRENFIAVAAIFILSGI